MELCPLVPRPGLADSVTHEMEPDTFGMKLVLFLFIYLFDLLPTPISDLDLPSSTIQ